VICATFGGYDFEKLDGLILEDLAEVGGAALWFREEETKAAAGKGKRHRR
jgi:hypothetical protein